MVHAGRRNTPESNSQFAKMLPRAAATGEDGLLGYAKSANEFRHIARVDFWLDVEQGLTS